MIKDILSVQEIVTSLLHGVGGVVAGVELAVAPINFSPAEFSFVWKFLASKSNNFELKIGDFNDKIEIFSTHIQVCSCVLEKCNFLPPSLVPTAVFSSHDATGLRVKQCPQNSLQQDWSPLLWFVSYKQFPQHLNTI